MDKSNAGFDSVLEYLYLRIYEFFYITGIRFIRQMRGLWHFVVNEAKYLKKHAAEFFRHIWIHIYSSFRNFFIGKYHALLAYRKRASSAASILSSYKENSFGENLSAAGTIIHCWAIFVFKILCTIFNYVAPVLAAVFLLLYCGTAFRRV